MPLEINRGPAWPNSSRDMIHLRVVMLVQRLAEPGIKRLLYELLDIPQEAI